MHFTLSDVQIILSSIFCVFGCVGVVIAYIAIRVNRQIQRESNARRAYLDYASLGIEHPELAFPLLLNINLDDQTIDGSRKDFERYEWFVSIVLGTVRFFLESTGKRGMWRPMMILQLAYHWEYLDKYRNKKEYLKRWSAELSREFDEAITCGKSNFNRSKYTLAPDPAGRMTATQ
jgi:hypothetical protein